MSDDLLLRPLDVDDRVALQELLDADPGYATRVTGRPPGPGDALGLLIGRPPSLPEDQKVVLGVFDGDALVAVVDLLRGWPVAGTVHIGLLQVDARRQGQGIGRRTHDLVVDWVRRWPEVTLLRIAVVETNAEQAAPFWAALGYTTVGEPAPFEQGTVRTSVSISSRPLVLDR